MRRWPVIYAVICSGRTNQDHDLDRIPLLIQVWLPSPEDVTQTHQVKQHEPVGVEAPWAFNSHCSVLSTLDLLWVTQYPHRFKPAVWYRTHFTRWASGRRTYGRDVVVTGGRVIHFLHHLLKLAGCFVARSEAVTGPTWSHTSCC